jgi:hypothetical protein
MLAYYGKPEEDLTKSSSGSASEKNGMGQFYPARLVGMALH